MKWKKHFPDNHHIRYWLKVEDLDIFAGNGQDVIATANVWGERNIMNGISDSRNGLRLGPLAVSSDGIFEEEHFSAQLWRIVAAGLLSKLNNRIRKIWFYLIETYGNHGSMETIHGFVPAEATQRELAGNVIGESPLGKVHNVRCFVNANYTINGTGSQKKTLVLRSKFNICHTCPWIDQIGSTNPTFHRSHRRSSLLSDCFFPDGNCTIERASGQHLAEFGMRPGQTPNRARVCFPAGGYCPDSFVILVPNLKINLK